jgi:hypothetical protein
MLPTSMGASLSIDFSLAGSVGGQPDRLVVARSILTAYTP